MTLADKKEKLNQEQQKVLRDFLTSFLPATGTKRKNTANELDYIHSTLDRIFIQHFGFNISTKELIDAFQDLNYSFYPLHGEWDTENKIVRPSKTGDLHRHGTGYSDFNASFLYIDVKADTVRFLRKATATLPPNTNLDKFAKTTFLLDSIQSFKKKQNFNHS